MPPIPRLKNYDGPALLSNGFRPFFLLGSIYAGGAILLWLAVYFGGAGVPSAFAPLDWHMHEMLYGYAPAAIAGFLLTAVPNWTGRLPLQGRPLAALAGLWAAGRVAVFFSGVTGWAFAALVDCLFPLTLGAVVAREIVAGRNWRNLVAVALVTVLFIGDVAFHLESHLRGAAVYGARAGLAATIMLIIVVGGRVVPSFTRNWLARENPGRLPAPAGRFDVASTGFCALALAAWTLAPHAFVTGVLAGLAGAAQAFRLSRWAGDRTGADALVLILHVAYAFIPMGFLLAAAAAFDLVSSSAGTHAFGAGAIGVMTLAIMSRASLGHTGRALFASPPLRLVYVLAVVAALARVAAALLPEWGVTLLLAAGFAWSAAFLGFAALYWPILTKPRASR